MVAIMIVCPETGRHISTDIEADAATVGDLAIALCNMICPACGTQHFRNPPSRDGPVSSDPPTVEVPTDGRDPQPVGPAAQRLELFCELVSRAVDERAVDERLTDALRHLIPPKSSKSRSS